MQYYLCNLRFLKVLLQVKFSSSDESSNDGHNVCVHKFNNVYYCNDDHRPIKQVTSDFVEKNVCLGCNFHFLYDILVLELLVI